MILELPKGKLFEYPEIVHIIRQYADDGVVIDKLQVFPAQAEHMNEWAWVSMGYKEDQEIIFLYTIFGKHELKIIYNKPNGVESKDDQKQPGNSKRVRQPKKGKRAGGSGSKDRPSLPRSHPAGKA
jgi:hypothetical protein